MKYTRACVPFGSGLPSVPGRRCSAAKGAPQGRGWQKERLRMDLDLGLGSGEILKSSWNENVHGKLIVREFAINLPMALMDHQLASSDGIGYIRDIPCGNLM